MKNSITDQRRLLEMVLVMLTATGKFVFMDWLNHRLIYVSLVVVFWLCYLLYRYKHNKHILRFWGFRSDNLSHILKLMLPFGVLAVVTFFVIGYYQDSINITWHILPLLVTYPIWGTVQQYLTMALVAGNLNDCKSLQLKKHWIVVITAILFAVVHYPNTWLMIGTFILALFYGYVYLKVKNLYALGLFHGWLGALFYYTVVNRDPFQEIFLKFIN